MELILDEVEITQNYLKLLVLVPDFIEGMQYDVVVTHVETPGRFFVRLSYNEIFIHLISKIPRYTLTQSDEYNVGDLVLYCEGDHYETLRRGRVVYKPSNNEPYSSYEIFAIDYGFKDRNIKRVNIYHCNIDIEPLAYESQLYGCQPIDEGFGDWDPFSGQNMRELCKNKLIFRIHFVCHFEDRLVVDLWTDEYNLVEFMIRNGWLLPYHSFYA